VASGRRWSFRVTVYYSARLDVESENVTTNPTDRHTVRGEGESRPGSPGRAWPGAREGGYQRCNIKQSGAWPYCSIACQWSPRRTAPAGPASSCDWLESWACATLAPSVALLAPNLQRMQRPGPRFRQEGWGGHIALPATSERPGVRGEEEDGAGAEGRPLLEPAHAPGHVSLASYFYSAAIGQPSDLAVKTSTSCVKLCQSCVISTQS
jgi:hypothetical protein